MVNLEGRGETHPPSPPNIIGLKLCCVVVGPFFLVELAFLLGGVGVWGVCKGIIVSNPTGLRLGCGWFVVRLEFWQLDNIVETIVKHNKNIYTKHKPNTQPLFFTPARWKKNSSGWQVLSDARGASLVKKSLIFSSKFWPAMDN